MDESIFGNARFIDTSDESVTNEELAKRYQEAWRKLETIAFRAKQFQLCLTSSDLVPETPQQGASQIYFQKMIRHGSSILKFCPEPIGTVGDYDRDSAAAIARVVYENYLALFYACLEKVSEDEWDARNSLLGLRSVVSGRQIWEASIDKPPSEKLNQKIEEVRVRLRKNSYFCSLPEAKQRYFLTGQRGMFFTNEELSLRLGNDKQKQIALYKILSNSVHSTPSAFRMYRHEDWSNEELRSDLELSALALSFAAYYLNRATIELKQLIPGWEKFTLQSFASYKKLKERDEHNEILSKERKAKRRQRGEWL